MDEFIVRLMRATAFGGATLIGLLLGKVGLPAALAVATAVFLLMIMNVLRRYVMPLCGLAVIWGALVAAGVAPSKEETLALARKGADSLKDEVVKARSLADSPLAAKLEELKITCDKGLLEARECEAARAKILADFQAK